MTPHVTSELVIVIEGVILDMLTLIAVENAHLDILGRAVGKNAAVTA